MSFLNLWGSSDELVGLDIGSCSLKVAQLAGKSPNYTLVNIDYIGLPTGTIVNGEIIDAFTLEGAIKELFSKAKIKAKSVAFAVCGNSVISKNLSLPLLSEEELKEQIPIIAAQYIPFPIEEMNVDYQILPSADDQAQTIDVNIIAVRKNFLETFVSVLKAADLKPIAVDSVPTALSNLCAPFMGEAENVAIIHMGSMLTHFVILEKQLSTFSREIQFGGQTISEDIREKLKMSLEEADALKMSSFQEKHLPQETLDIIEASCEHLVAEVQQSLNAYSQDSEKGHISKIYLSGGCAKIEPLKEWVSNKTGIPTEIFTPFDKIKFDTRKTSEKFIENMAPLFSVALGLATRSPSS